MLFSSPEALHCTAATERARRGREVIAAVVELGQGAEHARLPGEALKIRALFQVAAATRFLLHSSNC